MPYPVPSDISGVDDVEWYLVAIPADPAYRQAALDAYSNLADRWRWGMEKQDAQADEIEQHWLAAIALTLELLSMNPILTIIGHIDEIEEKLDAIANRQTCCDGNTTYGPPTVRTNPDELDYNGTSYPTTWGESETPADVEDWRELVCGQAHTWVDWLVATGANIDQAVVDSLLTIGAIAAVLGALATGGISVLIAAAVAGTVFKEILSVWSEDMFTDAAAAIESARDSIICAFLSGDVEDLETLVESTVGAVPWATLYKWIDYETAINTALYGEIDGQYVTPRLGETCPCGDTPAGYTKILVTAYDDKIQINGGDATHLGNGIWQFTGNANAGASLEPAWATLGMVEGSWNGLYGVEFTVKSLSPAVNFACQTASSAMHETQQNLVVDYVYRSGDSSVQAWLDGADVEVAHPTRNNDNQYFRLLQWGGSGAYTATVELYVLWDNDYLL